MTEQQFTKYFNYVINVLTGTRSTNQDRCRWHLSFGTHLYYMRDRTTRPYPEADIDICLFYEEMDDAVLTKNFGSFQFELVDELRDDTQKKALHQIFRPVKDLARDVGDASLDIYYWYPHGRNYYHCYQKTGGRYEMKGIEKHKIDPLWQHYWKEESYPVYLPYAIGGVLDSWYPGWFKRDRNFGVSKSKYMVYLDSFKQWNKDDYIAKQLEKSGWEYNEFVEEYKKRI
jgi:hypothetical protein